jgi:hypothetical protein
MNKAPFYHRHSVRIIRVYGHRVTDLTKVQSNSPSNIKVTMTVRIGYCSDEESIQRNDLNCFSSFDDHHDDTSNFQMTADLPDDMEHH